jgi:hypothetical protein
LILPDQARGQVGAMRVSALNLFGPILGPFLPGFFNNYLIKNSSAARRTKKTCVLRMTVVFLRAINFAERRRRPDYSAQSERRS